MSSIYTCVVNPLLLTAKLYVVLREEIVSNHEDSKPQRILNLF